MPTLKRQSSIQADGRPFTQITQVTGGEANIFELTLPAAAGGAMTTKTSASVGLFTTSANHGLTTSDKVSIFWTDTAGVRRARHYCSLSAASGTSLTTSTGTGFGTDLPPDGTAVTIGKVVTRTDTVIGVTNGLLGFAVGSGRLAGAALTVTTTPAGTDVFLNLHQESGYAFAWLNGEAFPVSGLNSDFAMVFAASGDTSGPVTITFVFINN